MQNTLMPHITGAPSKPTAYGYAFTGIDGLPLQLARFRGQVLLIVNTASRCGFTPHFAGLEQLYQRYKGQGLTVIGIPSNDFGRQEPGDADTIIACAVGTYRVTFPMTGKTAVAGKNRAPFYTWAAERRVGGWLAHRPRWNFHKYVIGRDGQLRNSFLSFVKPDSPRLGTAIEAALRTTALAIA